MVLVFIPCRNLFLCSWFLISDTMLCIAPYRCHWVGYDIWVMHFINICVRYFIPGSVIEGEFKPCGLNFAL